MELIRPETFEDVVALLALFRPGPMENIPLYYDETEKLLLPLRNVMEGLGGSVAWNKETKMTEVSNKM